MIKRLTDSWIIVLLVLTRIPGSGSKMEDSSEGPSEVLEY